MMDNTDICMKNPCQIRAIYTKKTIRVYQAYSHQIADAVLQSGTFVSPPFKMDRMTWIKPSFLWMMYRSGWGSKPGQERILGIDLRHEGFEWALKHSSLSHYDTKVYSSEEEWLNRKKMAPVRIQWDPDRDVYLEKMQRRTIQIGLSGEALKKYIHDWIISIEDITNYVKVLKFLIDKGAIDECINQLPKENVYHIDQKIALHIGIC